MTLGISPERSSALDTYFSNMTDGLCLHRRFTHTKLCVTKFTANPDLKNGLMAWCDAILPWHFRV